MDEAPEHVPIEARGSVRKYYTDYDGITLVHPDGIRLVIKGKLTPWCREHGERHGINQRSLHTALMKGQSSYKGWLIERPKDE